jgi:hypothetical protein
MLYLPAVMHQRRESRTFRWLRSLTRALARTAAPVALVAGHLAGARDLRAHEIPQRVAINAFVEPRDSVLRFVLRVPLESMRDVDFPLNADGSLDMVAVRALLPDAVQTWIVTGLAIEADGDRLGPPRLVATRLAIPTDRSFESYAKAVAHFSDPPLDNETHLPWQQALLDVILEFPMPRADAHLVLMPGLAQLGIRTTSVMRIVRPDAPERILIYEGDPERIALEPRWYDAAFRFVSEGFRHILGGYDHLLFVLCLVLPVRRWRPLVAIVTAFTLAHSITLGFATAGFAPTALWFPPFVEAAIAASIVWLALENILLPADRLERRWMLAFAFGLVHGFGFSFALGETLQFAGAHRVMALATFNIGVELGQLLVLLISIPVLRRVASWVGEGRERIVLITGSVLIAHAAWHWMTGRVATLAEYRGGMRMPILDGTFALGLLRFGLVLTVALAVAVALRQFLRTVWRP